MKESLLSGSLINEKNTMSIEAGLMKRMTLSLHYKVQDSHKSNVCFSKSLFSTIPTKTSTYTMILTL